ncbi:hypothetical protein HD806DRAFT_534380 [Xylariaceae sp. AK1471]|nr:hypothetical protein HD806DRAFT_534380 [Xylariaceae sp. AK1471]
MKVDLNKLRYARGRLGIISRYNILRAIRVFEVSGSSKTYSLSEEGGEVLALMDEILPGITGLCDFYWKITGSRSYGTAWEQLQLKQWQKAHRQQTSTFYKAVSKIKGLCRRNQVPNGQ